LKIALVTRDPKTNKVKVNHCVASFSRSDDLHQFEKDFNDALDVLKSQSKSTENAKKLDWSI